MSTYKWQFSSRFRRNAFGWKSQPPIQRIKEAVSEIKQIARKEPVLAAEGAVLFLEKLAPAIEQVDSSSGALGTAVNRAIATLVPIIAKSDVSCVVREKWLERLWEAIQDDDMPYLEYLGEFWGELCATPEIASKWADDLVPTVTSVWNHNSAGGHGFFKGTSACLSALYTAGRHGELLALLEKPRHKFWHDRQWGAKALASSGKRTEAIRYAEESKGLNAPLSAIANFCEDVLLSSGFADEAYARYAIEASYGTTNLAIFRSIAKKYPNKSPETILRDLVASQPGEEGKWFAAAKDAKLFDLAIELITRSPTDPRTLIRAARDFAAERPDFAVAAGVAGLRYIMRGYGFDITNVDVLDAYDAVFQAATVAGIPEAQMKAEIRELISATAPYNEFVGRLLARRLAE